MKVELSDEIERPVSVVFKFFAEDHVQNHPRWDPYIELWRDSDEPIGVGTLIRRRNSRSRTPVEGTMETPGRATFESLSPERTKLTLTAEMPGLDDSMRGTVTESVRGSLRKIKELIENET